MRKRAIIAAGGTGGHMFPAQRLAQKLQAQGVDVLFVGAHLDDNRYFQNHLFSFKKVMSSALRLKNPFKTLFSIIRGTWQSFKIMRDFKPDVVIGFGSFHSLPILMAAALKRQPIILFEPNAFPGKVNRFFSRFAKFCAVQFSEAKSHMKGEHVEIKMPTACQLRIDQQLARDYFYLDPHKFTILVFGGSQGADSINALFFESAKLLDKEQFQVIHIAGQPERAQALLRGYDQLHVKACVKSFEEKMDYAWSAADFVICRSGASTVAELISFQVPGLFIPFPRAADDHQTHNARFVETVVGGALTKQEKELTPLKLKELLETLWQDPAHLSGMKKALASYEPAREDFENIIINYLRG
jgi:UDP-N-acetylglucosamine--N-acetylmuramyl-(pentapeptide) pyrophosphoryl-undecaprenol N-acetylglucosamine transferase